MKAISKYLFAIALLFGIAPLAVAQNYIEKNNIATHKTVTQTPTDGKFWITLEAFTTGTVTTTTEVAPADIVLVLDYSASMYINGNQNKLREAVATFVDEIQKTEDNVKPDKNGKHRIAIVLFSTDVYEGRMTLYRTFEVYGGSVYVSNEYNITVSPNLNTLLPAKDYNVGQSSVSYNGTDLIGYNLQMKTDTPQAMTKAKDILSKAAANGDYNGTNRSRVVVLFTDGAPTRADSYSVNLMNEAIDVSNQIKKSNQYGATVYTVGLFSGKDEDTEDDITTFMSYTSSDEDNKNINYERYWDWGWVYYAVGPYTKVSGEYSIIVDDASKLKQVFTDIASDSGNTGAAIGTTSATTVDVVSASFNLPKNAQTSDIQIYTAKCIGATGATESNHWTPTLNDEGKVKEFLFDDEVLASKDDITDDDVQPSIDTKNNIVSVTGFNFGKHYCAAKKNTNDQYTGEYAGYKVIIKIPIVVNDKAVGGNGTATNDSGSGIFLRDPETQQLIKPAVALFEHPEVNLPVNIWIEKSGLRKGESAKFKIFRAPYAHIGGETDTYQSWSAFDAAASWTPFTTVVITGVGEDESVTQKLNGLDGAYYYKIVEESWSWSYNNSLVTDDNTYMQHENPFKFSNTKRKDTIPKHAESVVTNKFGSNGQSKDVQSVDSREFFTKEAEQQEK